MNEQEELAAYIELQSRVEEARFVVESASNHDLSFGLVMSILSMFGRYNPRDTLVEEEHATLGWQRRAWNALLCGERIAHFWSFGIVEKYLSQEDVNSLHALNFRNLIDRSKQAVLLQVQPPIPDFSPTSDNLVYRLREQSKVSIPVLQAVSAYSAIEWALRIACSDELGTFDPTTTYPENWDGEWEELPMAIRASCVVAGEPNGQFFYDAHACQEFWQWWLDEAVPASWDLRELIGGCG